MCWRKQPDRGQDQGRSLPAPPVKEIGNEPELVGHSGAVARIVVQHRLLQENSLRADPDMCGVPSTAVSHGPPAAIPRQLRLPVAQPELLFTYASSFWPLQNLWTHYRSAGHDCRCGTVAEQHTGDRICLRMSPRWKIKVASSTEMMRIVLSGNARTKSGASAIATAAHPKSVMATRRTSARKPIYQMGSP